jgi:hypothetical protein
VRERERERERVLKNIRVLEKQVEATRYLKDTSFVLIEFTFVWLLLSLAFFIGLACQDKDIIVFRFIIEYSSSFRNFCPY